MAFGDFMSGFIGSGGMEGLGRMGKKKQGESVDQYGNPVSVGQPDMSSPQGQGGAIGNAWDKFKGGFTDDKGLFQGGAGGDFMGRFKEAIGTKEYKQERKLGAAQNFAQDFDPTNTESVKQMQQKMNAAGANLKVDGIMGPKTLGAVRAMQMGGQPSDQFSPVNAPPPSGQGWDPSGNPVSVAPPNAAQASQAGGPNVLQLAQQAQQQAGQPMGPVQQQDPYGFGTPAGGGVYGGQIGPWTPR